MHTHPLDAYIQEKVKEALDDHDNIIKKEDAEKIVKVIMPLLEDIVAQKIKLHLRILAEYLLESLTKQEEKSEDAKDT